MADLPSDSGSSNDTGPPRWVKVFGIIALALALLFGVLMLFGGGTHGPGRHTGGMGTSPPVSLVAAEHALPVDDRR
ncbi:hypothetical protein GCM10009555_071380 [Acrocarpospora macrocephala]|uniref:Uncharacterized protein n=1 Tax=Acrocarpospora macrocephala TaxID=150177 RepID=A0A5M3WJ79_9ACTN|nr:hypothetical protein [Acrocarpospora macrocephala]GES08716.1 hypothetical protein Amac_023120 [Acrocarpospora macrocephala]